MRTKIWKVDIKDPLPLLPLVLFEVVIVNLNKMLPFLGNITHGENSFHRAYRNAGAAVDALLRIYVKHLIIRGAVDTIHGAHVSA